MRDRSQPRGDDRHRGAHFPQEQVAGSLFSRQSKHAWLGGRDLTDGDNHQFHDLSGDAGFCLSAGLALHPRSYDLSRRQRGSPFLVPALLPCRAFQLCLRVSRTPLRTVGKGIRRGWIHPVSDVPSGGNSICRFSGHRDPEWTPPPLDHHCVRCAGRLLHYRRWSRGSDLDRRAPGLCAGRWRTPMPADPGRSAARGTRSNSG